MNTPNNTPSVSRRDYKFGTAAGILIGILVLPVLHAIKPELFRVLIFVTVPFFALIVPLGLRIAAILSSKIAPLWQIAKFIVIGVLNTLVDIGTLSLLILLFRSLFEINPEKNFFSAPIIGAIAFFSLYKAISFIIANVNSYYWNKYWTFEQNEQSKKSVEFFQFFIVSIIGFFINTGIASYVFGSIPAIGGLNNDQWGIIGALCGTVAALAWNFLGYKLWVFKK